VTGDGLVSVSHIRTRERDRETDRDRDRDREGYIALEKKQTPCEPKSCVVGCVGDQKNRWNLQEGLLPG
jgi:hypothetical protein